LLQSLAMSHTMHTIFDRQVSEAPKSCPSSPQFGKDAVKEEYKSIGFPALSGTLIDTLLYTGILAAAVC